MSKKGYQCPGFRRVFMKLPLKQKLTEEALAP